MFANLICTRKPDSFKSCENLSSITSYCICCICSTLANIFTACHYTRVLSSYCNNILTKFSLHSGLFYCYTHCCCLCDFLFTFVTCKNTPIVLTHPKSVRLKNIKNKNKNNKVHCQQYCSFTEIYYILITIFYYDHFSAVAPSNF